jgi:hypothetical protein
MIKHRYLSNVQVQHNNYRANLTAELAGSAAGMKQLLHPASPV